MADNWISAETEAKEADFRGILSMHIQICKGIMRRQGAPPYLYADLYAGPGHLSYRGRNFLGSPLIAQELLTRASLPYEAIHFEKNPEVAARLAEALWVPTSLVDVPDATTAPIFSAPCEEGFSTWLDEAGKQPLRYGLVYSDPIDDEINYPLLNRVAEQLPRVDLLSYVAATQYKRRRGQDLKRNGTSVRPLLEEHIRAVDKRVVLIRVPRGGNQYTFIVWSNWVDLPDWHRRGFHRLDSDAGRQILDRINLTAQQLHEKNNTPLPLDQPYASYREYLRHPRFLAIRAQVFERAAGVCERCRRRRPTEPHHLRYPPWGAFDVPENLIAICHQCHCEIHGKAA